MEHSIFDNTALIFNETNNLLEKISIVKKVLISIAIYCLYVAIQVFLLGINDNFSLTTNLGFYLPIIVFMLSIIGLFFCKKAPLTITIISATSFLCYLIFEMLYLGNLFGIIIFKILALILVYACIYNGWLAYKIKLKIKKYKIYV